MQNPPLQQEAARGLIEQTFPQTPQLLGSLLRSVHWPEQHHWLPVQRPGGLPQPHWPPTQWLPFVHSMLQPPQLASSMVGSVQRPPQQVRPVEQTLPQAPQLLESDKRSPQ